MMDVLGLADDRPPICELERWSSGSRRGNRYESLCEPDVIQRHAARARVTPEAPAVAHRRRQCRMRAGGMLVDMAGEAASAAIQRGIESVTLLGLTQVTACALLSKQRVGGRGAEVRQVRDPIANLRLAQHPSRTPHDARPGAHEAMTDRRNLVGMARAASEPCVLEESGIRDQVPVCVRKGSARPIATVAAYAIRRDSRMRRIETTSHGGMAGGACCSVREERRRTQASRQSGEPEPGHPIGCPACGAKG